MIHSLRLQNFRTYKDKTFSFKPGTNILVGPNASGKTNVLEAILVSRTGSSYRAKDTELVMFKKQWCRLDSQDDGQTRAVKIALQPNKTKEFDINDKIYKRLPPNLKLPIVLFEPYHLRMLSGSPEGRRIYLDDFNNQRIEVYSTLLKKYNRSLAQRNSLLKSYNRPTKNTLFPWNIRLSQIGGQLVNYRDGLIQTINASLPKIYKSLSGDRVKVSITYKPQFNVEGYENNFLNALEQNTEADIASGFTSFGPHRDDFSVLFNNHLSGSYASRGELRTAVLALKIIELEELKIKREKAPIILLDDVYSELDGNRRKSLTTYLKDVQSIITTTDADPVLKNNAVANVIKIP